MVPSVHPAIPALTRLQALMERQRHALLEGSADELAALGAQLRTQVNQVRQSMQRAPGDEQARAQLEQLRQLTTVNLELLQRRMVQAQACVDSIGPGVPLLDETRYRLTYEAEGGLDTLPAAGRRLGQA